MSIIVVLNFSRCDTTSWWLYAGAVPGLKMQPFNALTAAGPLRILVDVTLSNARRFYLSVANPLAVKGLTMSKTMSPLML